MKRKIAVCANGWSLDALSDAIEGFRECAKAEDFDVFVFLSFASYSVHHSLVRGELNIYKQINPSDYDGIVIFSNMLNSDETVHSLCKSAKEKQVPVISIGMEVEGVPSIFVGNENGMRELITHLIEVHRAKKIVFIGGTEDHADSQERLRVTREVMEAHGLKLGDKDVAYGKWSNRRAIDAMDELLKRRKKLPDAIVCANDIMALAVCTELEKRGIRVPEDVAVTGFDNTENSAIFFPAITTVRADYAGVAKKACEIIYGKKKHGWNSKTVVPTIPVIAESCGCTNNRAYGERRRDYCRHSFQRDIDAKLLEQNERVMRERISDVSDYQDMKNKLRRHYQGNHQFEGSAFYLVLNDAYFVNVLSAGDANQTGSDGLKGLLDVAVAIKDDQLLEIDKVRADKLIPGYQKKKNEQHVYFLCPLHYYDHNYGYVVFTDEPYVLNDSMIYPYLEKMQQSLRLLRVNLRLKLLYDKDPLTGLYNRLGYENKVLPLYQECLSRQSKLTVFFIDINYMKNINDNYGHEQGDVAIKTVAFSIADCLQKDWAAVRYGGDEFLMIASNCGKQKAATVKMRIEERLRERVAEQQLPYELTASIGSVTADPVKRPEARLKDYIKEADNLMYQIKKVVHERHN